MPSPSPSPLIFVSSASAVLPSIPVILALSATAFAHVAPSILERVPNSNPLNIDLDPAPPPEDGPPASAGALRDKSYLPAQIGAIVGAYAFSLVLVAITLLCLAKKRREHLRAANDEADFGFEFILDSKDTSEERFDPTLVADVFASHDHIQRLRISGTAAAPGTFVPNFSYPSPTRTEFHEPGPYIHPSPISTTSAPGIDSQVDQSVVAADRAMAQQQLEEMYKYAFEHEEAKQKGTVLEPPFPAMATAERHSTSDRSTKSTLSKKGKNKPANLNLSSVSEEKPQSRTSSLFSALRSPKRKAPKGVNISSPIMTPQSGTFPRHEGQEMAGIPPRHYAPPPPPPIPTMPMASTSRNNGGPITPDISPQSVQSIDERIAIQLDTAQAPNHHNRNHSQAPTECDPESATSMHSSAPLVGLPASPRSPGFHRPSLPSSPKPGATFSRPNPPSAVRTGGSLPLRAYEPSLASPSAQTTKQTVFERKGPLSPTTGRTPFTAGAVPYSPYQPNTPIVPMTPSLVTKEDRKRMKRLVPKTPTMTMVESTDDVW